MTSSHAGYRQLRPVALHEPRRATRVDFSNDMGVFPTVTWRPGSAEIQDRSFNAVRDDLFEPRPHPETTC